MADNQSSNFAANLVLQFFIGVVLWVISASSGGALSQILIPIASLLFISFFFGMFYGLFRLAGVRAEGLETFYESFPLNSRSKGMFAPSAPATTPRPSQVRSADEVSPPSFDWQKLFSFQYLRIAGVILIITSIFSLLFNIHWELIHKIIASGVAGIILLGAAEYFRKKKGGIATFCSILSFALLEFMMTLLYQYMLGQNVSALLQSPDTWLFAKIVLGIVFLFTLVRYSADWQPLAYFLVLAVAPLSLQYVGADLSTVPSLVFIVVFAASTLGTAIVRRREELLIANAILSNVFLHWLITDSAISIQWVVLSLIGILLLAQLMSTIVISAQNRKGDAVMHIANIVIAHGFALAGMWIIGESLPLLNTYIGIAFLIAANVTLISYLISLQLKTESKLSDILLNTAIIVASAGLFIQVEGPWSAVVFLSYSCAVLWYSLYQQNLRTRIYGFVLLTISLIKLYLEFRGIFDQVWGTLAIMVIGLLLVVLSYKFEKVKDVMMHGLKQ
jgi:hypothetical protein